VLWLGCLVTDLSLKRPGFTPGSFHMWYVVDKVALAKVFLRVPRFSPVNIIPPWFSILIYHLGMNNRPVDGHSSETYHLTPFTWITTIQHSEHSTQVSCGWFSSRIKYFTWITKIIYSVKHWKMYCNSYRLSSDGYIQGGFYSTTTVKFNCQFSEYTKTVPQWISSFSISPALQQHVSIWLSLAISNMKLR
jgi:hypothetical protein